VLQLQKALKSGDLAAAQQDYNNIGALEIMSSTGIILSDLIEGWISTPSEALFKTEIWPARGEHLPHLRIPTSFRLRGRLPVYLQPR
jgi:hypothetical protein